MLEFYRTFDAAIETDIIGCNIPQSTGSVRAPLKDASPDEVRTLETLLEPLAWTTGTACSSVA